MVAASAPTGDIWGGRQRRANMNRDLLVGTAAGATSALFWFSILSGISGGVLLAYLSPFPLLLSGLNLGMRPMNIAAAVAVVLAAVISSPLAAGLFAASIALPSWIIVRQALLGQVKDETIVGWFPVGHILAMIAGLGTIFIAALAVTHLGVEGGLEGAVESFLKEAFATWFVTADGVDPVMIAGRLVPFFPGLVVSSWILLMVVNATVAQGLLVRLGRNIRPSPAYARLTLPDWLSWAFVAAAALSLIGSGDLQYVGRNVAIVLAVPFFFLGLSTVHTAAQRLPNKRAMLAVFYMILLFFGWSALAVAGLGFFEQWAGLRHRFNGGHTGNEEEE